MFNVAQSDARILSHAPPGGGKTTALKWLSIVPCALPAMGRVGAPGGGFATLLGRSVGAGLVLLGAVVPMQTPGFVLVLELGRIATGARASFIALTLFCWHNFLSWLFRHG